MARDKASLRDAATLQCKVLSHLSDFCSFIFVNAVVVPDNLIVGDCFFWFCTVMVYLFVCKITEKVVEGF